MSQAEVEQSSSFEDLLLQSVWLWIKAMLYLWAIGWAAWSLEENIDHRFVRLTTRDALWLRDVLFWLPFLLLGYTFQALLYSLGFIIFRCRDVKAYIARRIHNEVTIPLRAYIDRRYWHYWRIYDQPSVQVYVLSYQSWVRWVNNNWLKWLLVAWAMGAILMIGKTYTTFSKKVTVTDHWTPDNPNPEEFMKFFGCMHWKEPILLRRYDIDRLRWIKWECPATEPLPRITSKLSSINSPPATETSYITVASTETTRETATTTETTYETLSYTDVHTATKWKTITIDLPPRVTTVTESFDSSALRLVVPKSKPRITETVTETAIMTETSMGDPEVITTTVIGSATSTITTSEVSTTTVTTTTTSTQYSEVSTATVTETTTSMWDTEAEPVTVVKTTTFTAHPEVVTAVSPASKWRVWDKVDYETLSQQELVEKAGPVHWKSVGYEKHHHDGSHVRFCDLCHQDHQHDVVAARLDFVFERDPTYGHLANWWF